MMPFGGQGASSFLRAAANRTSNVVHSGAEVWRRRRERVTNDSQFINEFEGEYAKGSVRFMTPDDVARFKTQNWKVNEPRDESHIEHFIPVCECTMSPDLAKQYIQDGTFKKEDRTHYVRTAKVFVAAEDGEELELVAGGHRGMALAFKYHEKGAEWILILSQRVMEDENREALVHYRDCDNDSVDGLAPQIPDILDALPGLMQNYLQNPDGCGNDYDYVVKNKYPGLGKSRYVWLKETAMTKGWFAKGSLSRVKARRFGSGGEVSSVMRQQCDSFKCAPDGRTDEALAVILTLKGTKGISINGSRGDGVKCMELYFANATHIKPGESVATIVLPEFDKVMDKIVTVLQEREKKRLSEKKTSLKTGESTEGLKTEPKDYGLVLPEGVPVFTPGLVVSKVKENAQSDDKYLMLWRRVEDFAADANYEIAEGIYHFMKEGETFEFTEEIPAGAMVRLVTQSKHTPLSKSVGRVLQACEAPKGWHTGLQRVLDKATIKVLCEKTLRRRLVHKLNKETLLAIKAGNKNKDDEKSTTTTTTTTTTSTGCKKGGKGKKNNKKDTEINKTVIKASDKIKKASKSTVVESVVEEPVAAGPKTTAKGGRGMKKASTASAAGSGAGNSSTSAASSKDHPMPDAPLGTTSAEEQSMKVDADAQPEEQEGEKMSDGKGKKMMNKKSSITGASTNAAAQTDVMNDETVSTLQLLNQQANDFKAEVKANMKWMLEEDSSKTTMATIMNQTFSGVAANWAPLFKEVYSIQEEAVFKFATDTLAVNEASLPTKLISPAGLFRTVKDCTEIKYGDMANGVLLSGRAMRNGITESIQLRFRAQLKPSTMASIMGLKTKGGKNKAKGLADAEMPGLDGSEEAAKRLFEVYEEPWKIMCVEWSFSVPDEEKSESGLSIAIPMRKKKSPLEVKEEEEEEEAPVQRKVKGGL
ncbi:unnamed protein product [Amoebophrya sp. A25]|nr:unnamed protein product [Amoebophrya sp. A25]|eukprot:GSA25T00022961001.1